MMMEHPPRGMDDLEPAPLAAKPSQLWWLAVAAGHLHRDADQERLLPQLDQVATALHTPMHRESWRGVTVWRSPGGEPTPQGVYLFGEVGRGKSRLMQMLFDSVPLAEKRRVHFHPFMEELHLRLHHARAPKNVDLMLYMASELSAEARLLCFDEFFITTIADGMLLGRLLEALFKCGVTVCATSNWAPDHLFQDGFNRERVLPFIGVLKRHIQVCELGHGVDWRRREGTTAERATTAAEHFAHLTGKQAQPGEVVLRRARVPAHGAEDGVFWFEFNELCTRALGRAEYMNLCDQARTVIITGLPRLNMDCADWAMRFVVLVDLLYEHRVALRVHGQVDIEEACPEGPASFAWRRSVSRVHELSRYSGVRVQALAS